jgi:transposase
MDRKKYSKEFKIEAVRLSNQEDVTVVQVAEELGITAKRLYKWRKELREAGEQAFPGAGKPRDEEIAKLRRELRRVQQERDILKKAMSVFARDESRSMNS